MSVKLSIKELFNLWGQLNSFIVQTKIRNLNLRTSDIYSDAKVYTNRNKRALYLWVLRVEDSYSAVWNCSQQVLNLALAHRLVYVSIKQTKDNILNSKQIHV